jgi:hypothetical protein
MNQKVEMDQAFPAQEVSPQLRNRVLGLADRSVRVRRWKRVPALVLASAAAVMAVFIFVPRAAHANTLSKMQAAFDQVNSYRMTTYIVDDSGKSKVNSVTECINDHVREERGTEITYSSPDSTIVYKPFDHTAIRYKAGNRWRQLDGMRHFLDELKKSSWVKGLTINERSSIGGRPVLEVSLLSDTEPSRLRIIADKASMLPISGIVDWKDPDGSWRRVQQMEVDYSAKIDPTRVQPTLAHDVRVVDNEQLKADWQKRLDKGILTINDGGTHIVIRDALVLDSGDVMVLYTNGMKHIPFSAPNGTIRAASKPTPLISSLTDDRGNTYLPVQEIQGTSYTTKDDFVGGYRFGDEDLQAAWFTPLKTGSPARKATLHFIDGTPWTRTVDLRPGGDVPEWCELIGGAPRDAMEVEAYASQYRASYFLSQADDPTSAEREITKSIHANDTRMAQLGETVLQGYAYSILGSALHQQGKDKEARSALERAIKEDPNGKANYEILLKQLEKA